MKVPVKRVMAFIFSVIILSLSSLILSGYGSWPQSVAGLRLFPFPESSAFDSDILRVSQGERSVSIQTGESLTLSFQLSTFSDDAVVSDVTAGRFRDFPEAFIGHYFGGLSAWDRGGGDFVRFRWTAPIVERTEGGRVVISARGESRTTNGRLELRAEWATCTNSPCQIDIEVAGSKRLVAVDPPYGISKQSDTTLELQSQSSLSLTFDDGAPPELTKLVDLPPGIWLTLEGLWRPVLLFAPWIFAYWWFRSRAAEVGFSAARIQGAVGALRPLLLGAVVTSAVQAINWLQSSVQGSLSNLRSSLDPQALGSEWFPVGNPQTVAAVVGLLALWSWRARSESTPSPWIGAGKALILLVGGAAVGLAGLFVMERMTSGEPRSAVWFVAPSVGVVLAAIGAVIVSHALSSRSGWVKDGLCAAALVASIAFALGSFSVNASVLSGVLTLLVLVGFVSALICTIINTLNTQRVQRRRVRNWIRAAVVVFAAAFVIPSAVSFYALFPVSPYDAIRVAFAVEPFLRLGLIVAAIMLLRAVAFHGQAERFWRPVSIGAVALLALRPEGNVVGIPLSFLVGLLLTATFLVRPTGYISYPSRRSDHNDVRRLLDELRAIRMGRELRLALRKRVQSGDLQIEESDKIALTVSNVLDAPTSPPTPHQRHAALGWAGTREPMQRALMAAAVSTAIGALFSIPLLAQSLSDFDLRGSNASETFLTSILTFRFPFYGFVFGYFLPLFNGNSGLAKATRYFVVLGTAEAIAVLVPYNPEGDLRGALTVLLVQLAMMCGILGVGADLMAIRKANEGVERLADLYNMSRLALWSTGVAASAVTALITALLGAALTTATQSLLPPPPPPIVEPQKSPPTESAP